MKIKLNVRRLCFFLLVFPFLFPQGLSAIDGMTSITQFIAACRYIISISAMLYMCNKKYRGYLSRPFILTFILAILFQIVALYRNNSITLTVGLSCLTFIGFIIINIILFKKDIILLLSIYRNFLTVEFVIHVLMKFLNISLNGVLDSSAVYLMGHKNLLTPYVILAFVSEVFLLGERSAQEMYKKLFVYSTFLSVVSLINASSGEIGAMILIDGYVIVYYLIGKTGRIGKSIQRVYVLFSVVFVITFFYFVIIGQAGNSGIISIMSSLVGKDATFSGRRKIWAAAIMYIKSNPLWGFGLDIQYDVWNNYKYVYSAHNMFLDYAVKYGCLSLVFMVSSIGFMLKTAISYRKDTMVRFGIIATMGLIFASFFEAIEGIHATWAVMLLTYMMVDTHYLKNKIEEIEL